MACAFPSPPSEFWVRLNTAPCAIPGLSCPSGGASGGFGPTLRAGVIQCPHSLLETGRSGFSASSGNMGRRPTGPLAKIRECQSSVVIGRGYRRGTSHGRARTVVRWKGIHSRSNCNNQSNFCQLATSLGGLEPVSGISRDWWSITLGVSFCPDPMT